MESEIRSEIFEKLLENVTQLSQLECVGVLIAMREIVTTISDVSGFHSFHQNFQRKINELGVYFLKNLENLAQSIKSNPSLLETSNDVQLG